MYIFYISTRAIRNFLQISRALSRNKCPRCCSADCYFIIHKPRVICSTENFRESKKKREKKKNDRVETKTRSYITQTVAKRGKKREREVEGILLESYCCFQDAVRSLILQTSSMLSKSVSLSGVYS